MLMKSLLNRINGGADTSSSRTSRAHRRFSGLTYEKFQNLPDLLLRLLCSRPENLETGQDGIVHAQKVFPALEIVEKFGLPVLYASEIKHAVLRHLEGPIWPLREKAAKALSSIVHKSEVENEVHGLLSKNWQSQNALHGRLLCLRMLLSRFDCALFVEMEGQSSI